MNNVLLWLLKKVLITVFLCSWSDKVYSLVMQLCMGKACLGGKPVRSYYPDRLHLS